MTAPEPGFLTFYHFATATSAGIALVLPFVPVERLGRKFFILMSLIAIVLLALATVASGLAIDGFHLAFAGLLIAYNVSLPAQVSADVSVRRQGLEGGPRPGITFLSKAVLIAAAACGATGLVLDALRFPVALESRLPQGAWIAAIFLSSALLLGGSLTAMVLGHWYLVARKLSFAPLARIALVFLGALLARLALSGISIWAQSARWEDLIERSGWTGFFIDPGVFVTTRLLFGFAAPLPLGWMAWKCIEIRSNQSATGILYVTLAFVLIGEIIATYFLVSQGLVI